MAATDASRASEGSSRSFVTGHDFSRAAEVREGIGL